MRTCDVTLLINKMCVMFLEVDVGLQRGTVARAAHVPVDLL
jgi:hypothetical protein